MRYIQITGSRPPRFDQGFALLREDLDMTEGTTGYPVHLEHGTGLRLHMTAAGAALRYQTASDCYLGLSLLGQHWGRETVIEAASAFASSGILFDVSRNAVLKPETIRFFLRKMALLGLNLGMMYTEDTYEVTEYPYFGYLRGKYTKNQLRQLDDYADALGIELIPCIQTLGHLNRVLHWPAMAHMKDTEEVLLADDPAALELIRAMLKNASEPYRSRKIHIGMDEAHSLGLGAYLRRHGYTDPFRIMQRHLENVNTILRELKLEPMMWSDMYFRLASPTGGYYDAPELPREVVEKAPPDISLVYWDYYGMEEAVYDRMFSLHGAFSAPTAFACGLWTWTGPAPHPQRAVQTMQLGLGQAKKHRVPTAFAAAWGDNGAECDLRSAAWAMTAFAQLCRQEEYDPADCAERLRTVFRGEPQAFLDLTRFNQLPGIPDWSLRPVNASKFLLYQDPLVPLYDADLEGVDTEEHYAALEAEYSRYQQADSAFCGLWRFYAQLARTLKIKCAFHLRAGTAVRANDREAAQVCAGLAHQCAQELEQLRLCWQEDWYQINRPYGFEILDVRIGGAAARMRTAAWAMEEFAQGKTETIESLAETPLPYTVLPDGALRGSYAWGEIVSACKADL